MLVYLFVLSLFYLNISSCNFLSSFYLSWLARYFFFCVIFTLYDYYDYYDDMMTMVVVGPLFYKCFVSFLYLLLTTKRLYFGPNHPAPVIFLLIFFCTFPWNSRRRRCCCWKLKTNKKTFLPGVRWHYFRWNVDLSSVSQKHHWNVLYKRVEPSNSQSILWCWEAVKLQCFTAP